MELLTVAFVLGSAQGDILKVLRLLLFHVKLHYAVDIEVRRC